MRTHLRIGLLALGSVVAVFAHGADQSERLKKPEGVVDAFHAALEQGREDQARSFLAPDVLIMESGSTERSAAEYGAHHLPADVEFSRSVTSTLLHRTARMSGELSWIASEYRVSARSSSPRDASGASLSTETMVLQRAANTWKIVHVHWSSKKLSE